MWWVNGTPQSAADGLDRGLEFGDGLFETMALVGGRIRLLERHLARLEVGCARLQLQCPERSVLLSDLSVAAATPDAGLIKLIVTRGRGGTGYRYPSNQSVCRYVTAQPQRVRPTHYVTEGIAAQWVSVRHGSQPLLAGLKHLNRLEQVLARAQVSEDVAEGLMLDQAGHLISGTMTNVFVVIDNQLVTPALVHCGVAGAMRAALLDAWQAAGHAVEVRTVHPSELSVASEVFVCNALIGVWPITRLDASHWSVGPYARQAQAWIAQW